MFARRTLKPQTDVTPARPPARAGFSGTIQETRPRLLWVHATLLWFTAVLGLALALQFVVVTVDIGPFGPAAILIVALSALIATVAGDAFWRLIAVGRGRRRAAAALLLLGIAWAVLAALSMAWFIAAFLQGVRAT